MTKRGTLLNHQMGGYAPEDDYRWLGPDATSPRPPHYGLSGRTEKLRGTDFHSGVERITDPHGNQTYTMTVQPSRGTAFEDFRGRLLRDTIYGKLDAGHQVPDPEQLSRLILQHRNQDSTLRLSSEQFATEVAKLPKVPISQANLLTDMTQPGRGIAGEITRYAPDMTRSSSETLPALRQHPWLLRQMRNLGLSNKTILGRLGRSAMRHPIAASVVAGTSLLGSVGLGAAATSGKGKDTAVEPAPVSQVARPSSRFGQITAQVHQAFGGS